MRTPCPANAREGGRVTKFSMRAAVRGQRTDRAAGAAGPANGLAELHQRLAEASARPPPQGLLERTLETTGYGRAPYVAFLAQHPRRDPQAVRLHRNDRCVEGDRRDRAGGVPTDPGETLKLGHGARPPSAELARDDARGLVQPVRARVVPCSLPELEHPIARRGRERLDGRERPEESLEVRTGLLHAGLLEEDLREPDRVRRAVASPGQRASVVREPGEERRAKGRRERGRGTTRSARPHVPRLPEEL